MKNGTLLLLVVIGGLGFLAWRVMASQNTAAQAPDRYQSPNDGQASTASSPTMLDNIIAAANALFGIVKQVSQSAPSNT